MHLLDALFVHCARELKWSFGQTSSCIYPMHCWFSVPHLGDTLCFTSYGCICPMHCKFSVPRACQAFYNGRQVASIRCTLCSLCRCDKLNLTGTDELHLCDALYVHCAAKHTFEHCIQEGCIYPMHCRSILPDCLKNSVPNSPGCICAMHSFVHCARNQLRLSAAEVLVASVQCTVGSFCHSFQGMSYAARGCIYPTHFLFIVPGIGSFSLADPLVASVRCTLGSLFLNKIPYASLNQGCICAMHF